MDVIGRYRRLSVAQQVSAAVIAGSALRMLLFAHPALYLTLERRPELQTPLVSFRSLREGVYIYRQGTSPYDGGVFHHSPLYLLFFTHIIPTSSRVLTSLLWISCDIVSALSLRRIWQHRQRSLDWHGERAALVVALYLLNPYTVLSCLARSTTSIDNTLILLAIAWACEGSIWTACGALAAATHGSLYPILLLPSLAGLLRGTRTEKHWSRLYAIGAYSVLIAAMSGVNWLVAGNSWVSRTWGVALFVSDLTPNVGMWWYFFTEMFDHFRSFFLGVFQLHCLLYVLPVNIRLGRDPLFALLVLIGIHSTWKSYPTLGDMGLWAGLLGCFPEVVSNLRHPLFTLAVHLYTSILLPLLHSLWLLTGTGNANFFYAATMVYGLNACLAVVDVLGAGFRAQVKLAVLTSGLYADDPARRPGSNKHPGMLWPDEWVVVQLTMQDP